MGRAGAMAKHACPRLPAAQSLEGHSIASTAGIALPKPPPGLLETATLFLDLDGALLDITDRPDETVADAATRSLLAALSHKLDGRLAIVSGRSLAQIDTIVGEIAMELAVSGSHGCEHRWQGVTARPERPRELETAAQRMQAFVDANPGTLVEDKSFGVALHFRTNPAAEIAALALVEELSAQLGLPVQHGKMMAELRVGGGDKGKAVTMLMKRLRMAGTTPIFAGDDLTDEPGFAAAQALGGAGILIGPMRQTAATYALPSPPALRAWLAEAIR